jgi:hypothetical protein
MSSKGPEFTAHLMKIQKEAARFGSYPDGTIMIQGGDSFVKLDRLIIKSQLLGEGGVWEGGAFAGLDPFSNLNYGMFYTTAYEESLGDDGFHVWFPKLHTCPTTDYQVDDFQITVQFRRRLGGRLRRRFARFLGEWFESVLREGSFGEGPIKWTSDQVVFRGRVAQFRLDASRSGQDTLNWLLICVLNFGYDVALVQDFIFDQEKQISRFVEPLEDITESLPMQ